MRRMGRGDNLSTTSNYGKRLIVVLVHDPLDSGAKYDTREGEFDNGYRAISRVAMIFHSISGGTVREYRPRSIFQLRLWVDHNHQSHSKFTSMME